MKKTLTQNYDNCRKCGAIFEVTSSEKCQLYKNHTGNHHYKGKHGYEVIWPQYETANV